MYSPDSTPAVKRAAASGGAIAYEDTGGTGPALLLIPGLGDLRAEYRLLAPRLASRGYRVLTMDLRGHGDSDVGFPSYRAEDVGMDALDVLDHAGVSKAAIVGCSLAGGAAGFAAAQAPARVKNIVMLSPFTRDRFFDPVQRLLARVLLRGRFGVGVWARYYRSMFSRYRPADLRVQVARLRENLSQPGRMEALRELACSSRARVQASLFQVKAPTLVIMGGADPDFRRPGLEAKRVRQAFKGPIKVSVLPGLGHYPQLEKPELVAAMVHEFVAGRSVTAVRRKPRLYVSSDSAVLSFA